MTKYNLEYHLRYMGKNDLIIIKKENGYSRVYLSDKVSIKEKEIIKFLRQKHTRNMILCLLFRYACSLKELSKQLEKPPSSVTFHLKKLIDEGIIVPAVMKEKTVYQPDTNNLVERNLKGRETVYILKDFYFVYEVVIKYKKSLLDEKTDYILDAYKVSFSKKKNIRLRDFDDTVDNLIETLEDIFPVPYYY